VKGWKIRGCETHDPVKPKDSNLIMSLSPDLKRILHTRSIDDCINLKKGDYFTSVSLCAEKIVYYVRSTSDDFYRRNRR
jgi:hypothetical protein